MKNIMFILLFIMTSLFSATNSMAFNQKMEMSTDSMPMTMMTMDCEKMKHDCDSMEHDMSQMIDCSDCDSCQAHCYNLSNSMIVEKSMSIQNKSIKDILNPTTKIFATSDHRSKFLRPPIA